MGRNVIIKDLKRLADAMKKVYGIMFYEFKTKETISGEDLILSGTKEIDGKPVDPEKDYTMDVPALHEINYYRRLKRASNEGGPPAVKKFMDEMHKLNEKKYKKDQS